MTYVQSQIPIPFDLTKGQAIVAIQRSEREAVSAMPVQQLLSLVPDPVASQDPKRVAADPMMARYADLRREVQRAVEGAKARNAVAYGQYLIEGLLNKRPFITPSITLFHEEPLESVALGHGVVALQVPYGDFLVAIDGETQRLAWQYALKELPSAARALVSIVIHHGKTLEEARQGFYDLNTREVKPNAAVSISMDMQDVATKITRAVMSESDVLRDRVNLQRRQLRRSDPEVLTISALRTGIVTTILGTSGLQIGSRPVEPPAGVDPKDLERAVVEIWASLLDQLQDELEPARRAESIVSAPAVLAGIGILAHHAMPQPPRKVDTMPMQIEDVLELLEGVIWDRITSTPGSEPTSPWVGIAGKFAPSGGFSVGGPKEVGHAVADALRDPTSAGGKQIRQPPATGAGKEAAE